MPRETIEERRARLVPGAHWIRAQREQRGWTGRELARRMDIAQDRISAYERAQDEPPTEFARALAEVFGISEVEVWRGLHKPLPAEFRTDEETVAWARAQLPEVMEQLPDAVERITGGKPPESRRDAARKPPRVTRKSDKPPLSSQGRESAV